VQLRGSGSVSVRSDRSRRCRLAGESPGSRCSSSERFDRRLRTTAARGKGCRANTARAPYPSATRLRHVAARIRATRLLQTTRLLQNSSRMARGSCSCRTAGLPARRRPPASARLRASRFKGGPAIRRRWIATTRTSDASVRAASRTIPRPPGGVLTGTSPDWAAALDPAWGRRAPKRASYAITVYATSRPGATSGAWEGDGAPGMPQADSQSTSRGYRAWILDTFHSARSRRRARRNLPSLWRHVTPCRPVNTEQATSPTVI